MKPAEETKLLKDMSAVKTALVGVNGSGGGLVDQFATALAANTVAHGELHKKTNRNGKRIAWHDGGLALIGLLIIAGATVIGVVLN